MRNDHHDKPSLSLLALLAELDPIAEEFEPIEDLPAEPIDDLMLPEDEE